MIVALGVKSNGWAFTYPEVRHLQTAAELIDNILARARLTTEAALKAKIEHLALMSRGLAHDLKNLITPISSYLVHTTGRYEPGSAEHEVHLAARRSVRLITDYVRETLFFANRLTPKFEHVTLHTICRTAMEACAQRAEWRAVAMHSEIGENTRIWADGVLLQRVLINLLTNAIDASSAGASIFIKATITDSNGTHIEVIDEGMGIASDALKRIFEPFYTTKVVSDESRGFGLGLTICEKIVKLHNGCLSVHSTPGVGTTVRIDLPSNEGTMPVHQQMEAVPQIQN
jgi:signal transduction histidine kinase